MPESVAVLTMAYGTPRGLDDVEAYYTDIRRGRPPPPDLLEELRGRYRAIGGRSPLREITHAQARGLADRLGVPVYVGMKHSEPWIADAIAHMAAAGVNRAVGLVLAPHFSAMSVGDYSRRAELAARAAGWAGSLDVIESWHLEPRYLDLLAGRVGDAVASLPPRARGQAVVVFTAHSLPARLIEAGDPYADQLRATAAAVAARAAIERWRVAWQSAGRTDAEWLGPDVTEVVRELGAAGVPGVVVCPCGFVADHLEVLYDLDVECARVARAAGIAFARTASPNDDPAFLDALAHVVGTRLHRP